MWCATTETLIQIQNFQVGPNIELNSFSVIQLSNKTSHVASYVELIRLTQP